MADVSGAVTPPEQQKDSQPPDWFRDPPDELDPELAACLTEMASGMLFVKHPLVNEHYSVPQLNHRYNAQLAGKKNALAKSLEARDWHTYVFIHERPWRAEALQEINREHGDALGDKEYWQLLRTVWLDTENLWEWGPGLIRDLVYCGRGGRRHLMDQREQRWLMRLPERVTVHRGHMGRNALGWSWTTDLRRAEWFGRRYEHHGDHLVSTGRVRRGRIVAYLHGRGEAEVVVDPADVDVTDEREIA